MSAFFKGFILNQKILISIAGFLYLTGCQGLVETVDPGKFSSITSKLVVESYISPQSPTIEVKVTESLPLMGENKIDPIYIKNAVVTISGEGRQARIPYDDSTFTYRIDSSAFRIESGKTYQLTVTDGKRSVKATTRVPDKIIPLKSYSVDTVPGEFEPLLAIRLRFSWDDIRGETNYYSARGYVITENTGWVYDYSTNTSYIGQERRETILYDFIEDIIVFSDKNQDGLTITAPESIAPLPFDMPFPWTDENGVEQMIDPDPKIREIRFEILHINEDYFNFYRSLRDSDNTGNPFAEPVLIYTNVEGGLGCFGAYNNGINTLTF